jgi:hypothetical protein
MTSQDPTSTPQRALWEHEPRGLHTFSSPPLSYPQRQQQQQSYEIPTIKGYDDGGQVPPDHPQVVYVQAAPVKEAEHKSGLLGFCVGCATAICCCGCSVM